MAKLCRHHDVELGLVADGRWWTLVWAPHDGAATSAVFDAITWPEAADRIAVRAFYSLLRRKSFQVPEEERLIALLQASLSGQEALTDALGVQVRQAVELLVDAIGRAEVVLRGQSSSGLSGLIELKGGIKWLIICVRDLVRLCSLVRVNYPMVTAITRMTTVLVDRLSTMALPDDAPSHR